MNFDLENWKEVKKMTKVELTLWDRTPKFVKVGLWIGFSAGVTALGSYLLQRPELFAYYGLINFVLVAINELNKKVRQEKE